VVKITFVDAGGTSRQVEAPAGQVLMEAAVNQGIDAILAECGGAAACGTCRVYVAEQWLAKIGEPSPIEKDMIEFSNDTHPDVRLSCQISITDELEGMTVFTPASQKSE
jgi:2Fe-2S ferredoxin